MTNLEDGGGEKMVSSTDGIKDARKKGLPWLISALVLIFLVLLALIFFFILRESLSGSSAVVESDKSPQDLTRYDWPPLSLKTVEAEFRKTAVVSDNGLCSEIGRNILIRGGNAVDAAIATTFCVGALNLHSSGLGGGFLMTMYSKRYRRCSTIDARETAPLATHENTYVNRKEDAFTGYKSIATPGEVHGLWTAFKRYGSGKIAWQDLIMPTVNHLKTGYPATKLMEINLSIIKNEILNEPTMRSFFINNYTNDVYKEGDIVKNPALAETLRRLATSTDPIRLFYGGEMAQQIATEIFSKEGFLTKRDLEHYRSIVDERPIENDKFADSLSMCGPKPPSGFVVTQFIVAVMSKLYPKGSFDADTLITDEEFYHRFVEAQKYGYAQRTLLGDLRFQPNASEVISKLTSESFINEVVEKIKSSENALDPSNYGAQLDQHGKEGTSHISVVDPEGNAVSLTSSVNNVFGSRRRSELLGIIWNDQMDDFSIPGAKNFFGFEPSKTNYVAPGKRPMSSMSPLIIYDKGSGEVKAAVGASGGSKIISALAQFIVFHVNFNSTVKNSIDFPRIHNQFTPLNTAYENGFPQSMIEALASRGHNMTTYNYPFATIQAIVRNADGSLSASTDHRRPIYMNPAGY